jgi:hypothetical protein
VSGQLHAPAALPPGKSPWYPLYRKLGLDEMEKWKLLTLSELEPRPLSRPARSQSLYRLRYPDSRVKADGKCKVNVPATCFHAGNFVRLFGPEDGGDMFRWNIGWLSEDYTALYPKRQYSS